MKSFFMFFMLTILGLINCQSIDNLKDAIQYVYSGGNCNCPSSCNMNMVSSCGCQAAQAQYLSTPGNCIDGNTAKYPIPCSNTLTITNHESLPVFCLHPDSINIPSNCINPLSIGIRNDLSVLCVVAQGGERPLNCKDVESLEEDIKSPETYVWPTLSGEVKSPEIIVSPSVEKIDPPYLSASSEISDSLKPFNPPIYLDSEYYNDNFDFGNTYNPISPILYIDSSSVEIKNPDLGVMPILYMDSSSVEIKKPDLGVMMVVYPKDMTKEEWEKLKKDVHGTVKSDYGEDISESALDFVELDEFFNKDSKLGLEDSEYRESVPFPDFEMENYEI